MGELENGGISHSSAISGTDKQRRYKTLLDALAFPREDARLQNIKAARKNTCGWVFRHAKYRAWCDRSKVLEHHGFLWMKGKPGSGKSTIMKKAYERTKKNHSNEDVVAYFFNARASGLLEKSSLGMYRSLVHQILKLRPQFQDHFIERFVTKESQGVVDEWTATELQNFLAYVTESIGERPLSVFIDALDEGNEDDIRQMISFLEELSDVAIDNRALLKICLSSRHYPHISIKKGISFVVEKEPGHTDDIATYVSTQLQGDRDSRMQDLREKICNKAFGVFLWVVLVIPILNKLYDDGEVDEMNERLERIPKKLDDLFADILKKDTENMDKSVLLLQWTLFAKRSLSPVESYLAVKAGSETPNGRSSEVPDEETIKRYILKCSRGLTEVSKSNPPVVQFIHETVRDFLIHGNGLANLRPVLRDNMVGLSHDRLKECCFRYFLRSCNFSSEESTPSNDENPRKRKRVDIEEDEVVATDASKKLPFLEYAITNMFAHADDAESVKVSQRDFLKHFTGEDSAEMKKWIRFRNTFQRHKIRRYTPEAKLLYIFSEKNLFHLVRALIEDLVDVNAKGER